MKIKLLLITLVLSSVAQAVDRPQPSHAVGNGMPQPTPPLNVSYKLIGARAGIDYPTDREPPAFKVLLIANLYAIPVYAPDAQLQKPRAGIEFPTDSPVPDWVDEASVLVFEPQDRASADVNRLHILLSGQSEDLTLLVNQSEVRVADIAGIQKAQSGIDFPTDSPYEDYYVMVLINGTRIGL